LYLFCWTTNVVMLKMMIHIVQRLSNRFITIVSLEKEFIQLLQLHSPNQKRPTVNPDRR